MVTSSFEYFPGIPIFQSRDLAHWEQIGHALDRPEQLPLNAETMSYGIWAPTIRYYNGISEYWFQNNKPRGLLFSSQMAGGDRAYIEWSEEWKLED